MAGVLGAAFAARARANGNGVEWRWPNAYYRDKPVAFFREVLGVEPTEDQIPILEALVPDDARVAVKSGHKVGKSNLDVGAGLWFYCSFERARVVATSTTSRQVDSILWRELRMMHSRARNGIAPDDKALLRNPNLRTRDIGGDPAMLARSGLVSDDFREFRGFTARDAEAVAGTSGENLFYIVDEASGVPKQIFEAIEGNRAGGARLLLTSNPTKTDGDFFEAFGRKAQSESNPSGFRCFTLSSENTPNARAGRVIVPGLATRAWVEQARLDYGEDSPFYLVRVKGEFALNEASRIVSLAEILSAEQRWDEGSDDDEDDVLQIGLDPAGPGGAGDETVFCARRGKRVVRFYAFREQDEDAILVQLIGIVRELRRPRERPIVKVDREGLIGAKVFGALRAWLEAQPIEDRIFDVIGVRASEKATRDPANFDRVRDELWENMRAWLHDGGAIPQIVKLEQELHAPSWVVRIDLKRKAEAKEELRKTLGRSPDHADALALAVWDVSVRDVSKLGLVRSETRHVYEPQQRALDPYDAERAWRQ